MFGNLFAETTAVTEEAFAQSLMSLNKTGAAVVTGTTAELTREKAAQYIVKYLGYEAIAKDLSSNQVFSDVTTNIGEINLVNDLGIITGTTTFSPNTVLTEEEVQTILSRLQTKLQTPLVWKHACYAINSSSQMDWISDYDAVSFGWSVLTSDSDGNFNVKIDETTSDFKVPSGFEEPLDLAAANGTETYLMVYFVDSKGKAAQLFSNEEMKKKVIDELTAFSKGVTKDGQTRSFDGVTVDFEGFFDSSLKSPYTAFLKDLKVALNAEGKKLNVALQPTLYYNGYNYKEIGETADHVILMAHDYGAFRLSDYEKSIGYTETPLTPINEVYKALYEASSQIADKSKIALQISFASLQWQLQDGKVINASAYKPSYDKIEDRLAEAGTEQYFNRYTQSSYAVYMEAGIRNIIWYENTASITAKTDLARLLGINGISYWRLGTIPESCR